MSELTVAQLAETVGTPVEKLLEQLKAAGISVKGPKSLVDETQKQTLLNFLRRSHGEDTGGPQRITLQRKQLSTLKVASGSGTKSVQVEVRKKRTFVKRSAEELAALEAAAKEPVVEKETVVVAEAAPVVSSEVKAPSKTLEAKETAVVKEADSKTEATVVAKPSTTKPAKSEPEKVAKKKPVIEEVVETTGKETRGANEPHDFEAIRVQAELDARARAEEELRRRNEEAARKTAEEEKAKAKPKTVGKPPLKQLALDDDDRRSHKSAGHTHKDGARRRSEIDDRGFKKGKIAVLAGEEDFARGGRRKKRAAPQSMQQQFSKPTAPVIREIQIPETITVNELAQKMAVKVADLIKTLMKMGMMATINQVLDQDTAVLVVEELGHTAKAMSENALETELLAEMKGGELEQLSRPPVVTIMGHVDHGKTSLLDYIRRTKVAAGEAGGITQHIGAYHVETPRGVITFLDTPGHAAFTAMRARGAKATDIVVLVCAADDGAMPQTIEAIQHARAAEVPIVVAVTKVDKPTADRDKVRTDLSQHNVISEDWGGDTQFAYVSAKTGEGVDELLEKILLQSEVLELKANVEGPARGVVVEARLDKGRGPVATVLVQAGTLRKGDVLLCGTQYGRVRQLLNEAGKPTDEAGPSIPVEVLG